MEPVPAPPEAHRLARRVLTAAVAVQLLLFATEARRSARAALTDPARAAANRAVVAGMDPHGYYAWLRSALVDGDLDFGNEFAYCNEHWNRPAGGGGYGGLTPAGRHANQWSVGPALAWAVGVVPVHAALEVVGARGEGIEDGYTPPYQVAVAGVTFALGVATLLLMYATARRFAPPVPAAAAAAAVALGTPLLAYGSVVLSMAHGPAAAALSLFVYAWVRTLGRADPGRWFGLGVLLGVACLMRWQLATFGVLLALEAVRAAARAPGTRARWAGRLALAAAGAAVGFLPQMAAWQAVYGSPLVNPHSSTPRPPWSPALWQVLCSYDRGLFYYTPAALVAVVGSGWAVVRAERRLAVPLAALLSAGSAQVYAMAVMVSPTIFLGSSFGFRFLTETCVVLAPGLAACLALARPGVARGAVAVIGVLVGWNMLLVCGYKAACVPEGPADPTGLLRAVGETFRRRPAEAAVVAAAGLSFAAWFAAAVGRGLRVRPTTLRPAVPSPAGDARRAA